MKTKRNFIVSGSLLALFVAYTLVVAFVDVLEIGEGGTRVGLAALNEAAFAFFGVNLTLYAITDWIGVVAIAVAFGFAVAGFVQLIRRKSLLKVDFEILALGALYIVVIGFYLFFEFVIVNYRPIILYEKPEASYPSSHVMIVLCISLSAITALRRKIKSRTLIIAAEVSFAALAGFTVVGRLYSGVHWLTDIIGGIILSAALESFYYSFVALHARKCD